MQAKNIGTDKAWQKIKHYCAYQERNHAETRDKLYSYGLYKHEVETLLSQLIEETYLNEERYAIAFAGGHFRTKHWGPAKIKYALSQKKVSAYNIRKAVASIDEDEFIASAEKLSVAKLALLKDEENILAKKKKLQNFLLQKGYVYAQVSIIVNKLLSPHQP